MTGAQTEMRLFFENHSTSLNFYIFVAIQRKVLEARKKRGDLLKSAESLQIFYLYLRLPGMTTIGFKESNSG
jgi:hypothetical protein